MTNFWDLLKESVIIQGTITLLLIITICYLAIANQPVPTFLQDTTALVIGFWFGAKVQNLINKAKG